jgi:hypothetical protein
MIERYAQINLPIGLLSGLFLNQQCLAGAFLLPPGGVLGSFVVLWSSCWKATTTEPGGVTSYEVRLDCSESKAI